METILATAFGRVVNIQRGEADELTKAAHDLFRRAEEGQSTSRGSIVLLTSKCIVIIDRGHVNKKKSLWQVSALQNGL